MTEQESNGYQYTPLTNPAQSIRLLALHQNSARDISAGLITADLHNAPAYRAISYCWGPQGNTRAIHVDGKELGVTASAWYALWQARRYTSGYFWVDSICINQHDPDEKSAQVAAMSSIYSQAAEVLACIGPHINQSELLVREINMYWSYVQSLSVAQSSNPANDTQPSSSSQATATFQQSTHGAYWLMSMPRDRLKQIAMSLQKLSTRRFFTRLWIVQEMFLAEKVTFLCGDAAIDAEMVLSICHACRQALIKITSSSMIIGDELSVMWPVVDNGSEPLQLPVGHKAIDRLVFLLHAAKGQGHVKVSLSRIQYQLGEFQCQDARDAVFGTLSLVDWGRVPPLRPDYAITAFDLGVRALRSEWLQDSSSETSTIDCFSHARQLAINLRLTERLGGHDITAIHDNLNEANDNRPARPNNRIWRRWKSANAHKISASISQSCGNCCRLTRAQDSEESLAAPLTSFFRDGLMPVIPHWLNRVLAREGNRLRFLFAGKRKAALFLHQAEAMASSPQPGDYLVWFDRAGNNVSYRNGRLALLMRSTAWVLGLALILPGWGLHDDSPDQCCPLSDGTPTPSKLEPERRFELHFHPATMLKLAALDVALAAEDDGHQFMTRLQEMLDIPMESYEPPATTAGSLRKKCKSLLYSQATRGMHNRNCSSYCPCRTTAR